VSNAEQKEQGDRRLQAVPEVKPLQTADAQAARVAGASDIQAAQALNPDRHNGSAGGDQELSFELIAYGNEGFGKVVAARQPERLNAQSDKKDQMDTGTMLAAEAKTNPAAEPVKLFKEWLNKQPESPQKEVLKQEVRQQAADLSPEMKARMEHLAAIRRKIDEAELEEGGIHQAITPEMVSRAKLEGHVRHDQPLDTPDGWLEAGRRISELPIDKQLQVVGSGLMAGYQQYQADERERTWGQIIGTTEGLGAVAVNLATIAEFTCDCIAGNQERAAERGGKFGEAIGQTLVSGIKLFQDADAYLFKVGFDGDYGRPFKDLASLGMALNDRWSQLPPREQERVKYKLITEMAADGMIGAGGAKAIGKAKVFTKVLDAIAIEAKTTTKATIEGGKRAAKAVGNAIDDLVQPEVEIAGVGKVKYPRDFGKPPADKPLTHVLMSQADNLGGASRPGRLLVNGKDGALIKFENLKHLEISETVGDVSNTHWTGANFLTGWKVEGTLKDKFMAAGEALPNSFPVVDGWAFDKGLVTSIKSIDLRSKTYQDMKNFETLVDGYVKQLEGWDGSERGFLGITIRSKHVKEKMLHLGVPDGAMSSEQRDVLTKIAKQLESSGAKVKIKVTALK
jgi:hypothetical protein